MAKYDPITAASLNEAESARGRVITPSRTVGFDGERRRGTSTSPVRSRSRSPSRTVEEAAYVKALMDLLYLQFSSGSLEAAENKVMTGDIPRL